MAAALLAPSLALALAGFALATALGGAIYAPGNATILDLTPPEMRGVVTGSNAPRPWWW